MDDVKDPILIIDNLVKKYGKGKKQKTAVEGISLKIPRGSFFGFLGPNGAGKSSTISCVTGTAQITGGSISVDGIDVETEYKEARKKIGISPQEFNVDFFGQVDKILDFNAGFFGMPADERQVRVEAVLDQFKLQEHRKKSFNELSGGLKRRLVLARALVHNPELIILDEPTAGVDVELRHELWEHLRKLNTEGKTIILTSHYLEEVEQLCEFIAIINHGKIVACGTKQDFVQDGKTLEQRYLEITKGESY